MLGKVSAGKGGGVCEKGGKREGVLGKGGGVCRERDIAKCGS